MTTRREILKEYCSSCKEGHKLCIECFRRASGAYSMLTLVHIDGVCALIVKRSPKYYSDLTLDIMAGFALGEELVEVVSPKGRER